MTKCRKEGKNGTPGTGNETQHMGNSSCSASRLEKMQELFCALAFTDMKPKDIVLLEAADVDVVRVALSKVGMAVGSRGLINVFEVTKFVHAQGTTAPELEGSPETTSRVPNDSRSAFCPPVGTKCTDSFSFHTFRPILASRFKSTGAESSAIMSAWSRSTAPLDKFMDKYKVSSSRPIRAHRFASRIQILGRIRKWLKAKL